MPRRCPRALPISQHEIQRATDESQYQPAPSIWTRDIGKALRIAPKVEAGLVWINEWAALSEDIEEGGTKHSDLGRLKML
ncbi:aldehyde dehydrogenase family protein [Pseudochelatococcus contaminans]|uniref:aldehyde dehydrogenase family protein n=1 Tax=Pseudochelatococcus contaminans TaxID=1538103 RepID=UPI00161EA47A